MNHQTLDCSTLHRSKQADSVRLRNHSRKCRTVEIIHGISRVRCPPPNVNVDSVVVSHRRGDPFAMFFPNLNFAFVYHLLSRLLPSSFSSLFPLFPPACVFLRATSQRLLPTLSAWNHHTNLSIIMLRARKSRLWLALSSKLRPKRQRSPPLPDAYPHMDEEDDSTDSLEELMRSHMDGFYNYPESRAVEEDAKSVAGSLILRPSASLEDNLGDQPVVSLLPCRLSPERRPKIVSTHY